MRWGISGGAGFLGLHLASGLLADGQAVRTLDAVPLDDTELERGVEEVRGDVRDPRAAKRLVEGLDCARARRRGAPDPARRGEIFSVNVEGTRRVLEAARAAGVRRVVFVSSTAVYGVPRIHPIPERRHAARSRLVRRVEDRGGARLPRDRRRDRDRAGRRIYVWRAQRPSRPSRWQTSRTGSS